MRGIYLIFLLALLFGCKKTTEIDASSGSENDTVTHQTSTEKSDKAEVTKDSIDIEVDEENGVNGDHFRAVLNDDELRQISNQYHELMENHPDSTIASRESYADLVNNWIPPN
jgi:hypothetical protein